MSVRLCHGPRIRAANRFRASGGGYVWAMTFPAPRGPLSDWVLARLGTRYGAPSAPMPTVADDPLEGDDLHLALFLCYELHYGGLPGVEDDLEWDPALLAFRRELERPFEAALRAATSALSATVERGIGNKLRALVADDAGPSLSSYLQRHGTVSQYGEFLIHRSAYQLKEADPHTWAIPRLGGAAKVALVEIQSDEYGGGDPGWLHASLYARSMEALGLEPDVLAHLDLLPGSTLAWANLASMFGLHRRLGGALVGHLAAFEMTSCIPNRRYANGLRRLGLGREATLYFDEHVEADAVHEAIAANDLAGSLVEQEPELEEVVVFGARAVLLLEARFAERLLHAWRAGRSSLRIPLRTAS